MKKKLGFLDRDMNITGFALLFLILLQVLLAYSIYYIIAVSGGHQITISGFAPNQILKAAAEIKSAVSGISWAMPIALLFVTLFGDLIPFLICAKLTKMKMSGIFARPQLKPSYILAFGTIGIGASLFASLFVRALSQLLKVSGFKLVTPAFNIPKNSTIGAAALIFSVVVVAPIAEEFIFRGVLLNYFKRYGEVFAVIASSLTWAILHMNLVQGIPVFFMGLFFGIIALKARSIIPTILIHSINNAFSLADSAAVSSHNYILILIAGLIVISVLIAAIALLIIFFKPLTEHRKGGSKHGFTALFTCAPYLIYILICIAVTASTIKPI
ncbi:MAG TPA: type II CAAX endopeptidase family protein [Ruminiclostridium sp.]|nr:type II CAAX endopeptidase family protein [Ruminiclostridium sp.]